MSYWVYIASNYTDTVLYTGVTNNVERRMFEHRKKFVKGFTSKYNVKKLLFAEEFESVDDAIMSEKKIKGWTREKKLKLIKSTNPRLLDLLGSDPSA